MYRLKCKRRRKSGKCLPETGHGLEASGLTAYDQGGQDGQVRTSPGAGWGVFCSSRPPAPAGGCPVLDAPASVCSSLLVPSLLRGDAVSWTLQRPSGIRGRRQKRDGGPSRTGRHTAGAVRRVSRMDGGPSKTGHPPRSEGTRRTPIPRPPGARAQDTQDRQDGADCG